MNHPTDAIVDVSRQTLDTYRTVIAGQPSNLELAELCGRLAYCVGELLTAVETLRDIARNDR